jgi:D-sedoheptulose 7-phosphate isomerase
MVKNIRVLQIDGEQSATLEKEMQRIVSESLTAHQRLLGESLLVLVQVAQTFVHAIRTGHKILLFGNGGSAADAQHVAGELVGRFFRESEPWPAIALTTDTSILTAVGNDFEFADIFARQVRALARPGDVVVGISTSGHSPNVLRGLHAGRDRGGVMVGFTGANGSAMREYTDVCFCAPAQSTPRIQELHVLAWHAICEMVEAELMNEPL